MKRDFLFSLPHLQKEGVRQVLQKRDGHKKRALKEKRKDEGAEEGQRGKKKARRRRKSHWRAIIWAISGRVLPFRLAAGKTERTGGEGGLVGQLQRGVAQRDEERKGKSG